MKLFDFFRRKNKVEQEENVQEENKSEDSVGETAQEDNAQNGTSDVEVGKTGEVDETDKVEEAKDLDETNEADKIEQVDVGSEDEGADKDNDDTEEDDSGNEDVTEVNEENEDDEPSSEPDDDDIEEDEAGDDEIDEADTEEDEETEDEDETEDEEDDDDEEEEREHRELSFDYEQFEEELFTTFEEFMKGYLDRKEDMYIFSVNYFPDFTTTIGVNANSYSYLNEQTESDPDLYADYKFCEEEWEVGEWFESLSEQLQVYFDQLEEEYEDEEDTHDELYEEHRDRIIDICKNVMKRIKETDTFKEYPQMLLNVYVREFFGDEEMIAIFEEINGDVVPDDYMKFMKG